jgi:hypothetical protein
MERRRALRRAPGGDEPLLRVRLRTGRELEVVDLSNAGALVEGAARLLPGTHVDVHITTKDGRTLVRSRVVRAYVCHVEADLVRYRGALAFERPIDTAVAGYPIPDVLSGLPSPAGNAYPDRDGQALPALDERLSA